MQRVTIHGRRRNIGLGSPPVVLFAHARQKAFDNKRLVHNGGDPLAEKRKAKAVLTFEEAARKVHIELSPTWKNPKDQAAFLNTLAKYTFPQFGNVLLPDVTSGDVRRAILSARAKAPGVAQKLTYRVSAVFKWGIAEGMRTDNPALAQTLALPKDKRKPQHRKALPYKEIAQCIEAVNQSRAWISTKLALQFLIITAARSGEVRNAKWEEINLDAGVWNIPAERMKMQRPHRVPLSGQAIIILHETEKLKDTSGLIFPSMRGKALSDMTLSKLVRELGFDAHVHGFRSSFRTWAQEQTIYPREVAEAALAHSVGDIVERSYARSDLFEKRAKMMNSWAIYLAARRGGP